MTSTYIFDMLCFCCVRPNCQVTPTHVTLDDLEDLIGALSVEVRIRREGKTTFVTRLPGK